MGLQSFWNNTNKWLKKWKIVIHKVPPIQNCQQSFSRSELKSSEIAFQFSTQVSTGWHCIASHRFQHQTFLLYLLYLITVSSSKRNSRSMSTQFSKLKMTIEKKIIKMWQNKNSQILWLNKICNNAWDRLLINFDSRSWQWSILI